MKFYHEKLKGIRKLKKIRVDLLAARTGVTRSTIWYWEKGKGVPPEEKVRLIAEILDISVEEISNLKPTLPTSNIVDYSQINALLYSYSCANMNERKMHQRHYIKMIEKQFNESNQVSAVIDAFLNAVQTMFYAKDISSKYIIANYSFLKNVGIKKDYKTLGKNDTDFFSKQEALKNNIEDTQVIESGKAINYEGYIPGSKKKKWGIINKTPIFDNENKIVGIIGYFQDITLRKKAEQTIEKFINGLELIDESIWMAEKAIPRHDGGVKFDNFLYSVNKKVRKPFVCEKEKLELPFDDYLELAQSFIIDYENRERFDLDILHNKHEMEVKAQVRSSFEDKIYNIKHKVFYDPEKKIYVGILRENQNANIIAKIRQKLKEHGVDEKIINNSIPDEY